MGDKLIEGMIESVTPEADDAAWQVQRSAVRSTVDPNRERSEAHNQDMIAHTESLVEGEQGRSDVVLASGSVIVPAIAGTAISSAAAGTTQGPVLKSVFQQQRSDSEDVIYTHPDASRRQQHEAGRQTSPGNARYLHAYARRIYVPIFRAAMGL